jgi:hypothetical protein
MSLSNVTALEWGIAACRRPLLSLSQACRRLLPTQPRPACSLLAESLADQMAIAAIENSVDSRMRIAVRHRYAGTHRGFYLYADAAGCVAVIDTSCYQYLATDGGAILLIEGLPAARRFIDELVALRCRLLSKEPAGGEAQAAPAAGAHTKHERTERKEAMNTP